VPYTTLVAGTTITASWANASVRDQVVTPFATAAARTSAITSPVEGMVSYLADDDHMYTYDGSSWKPVWRYGASVSAEGTQNTVGTTTSTSYTSTLSGSSAASATITAPPSGIVIVCISGVIFNSSSAQKTYLSWAQSGGAITAADDTWSTWIAGTNGGRFGTRKRVSGLTPGTSYTYTCNFRVDGGTGTFDDQAILVYPQN